MFKVDKPNQGIVVETVEQLYEDFQKMEIPQYYVNGGVNPFKGLVDIIPRKARFFTLVINHDETDIELARHVMKRMANRRKVREILVDKETVNYNRFSPSGDVIVLYA